MGKKSNKNREEDSGEPDDVSVTSDGSYESSTSFQSTDVMDEGELFSKIESTIDQLTESRPETRITALVSLCKCFQRVIIDLPDDLIASLSSSLDFCLKKVTDVEKVANLIAISAVQLGPDTVDNWLKNFHDILDTNILDATLKPSIRGACATALSMLIWQSSTDIDLYKTKNSFNNLAVVLKTARLKGDGKSPVHDEQTTRMQEECILSWIRVFLSLPSKVVLEQAEASIEWFVSIMQNISVSLRIAAAEALAIVFEYLREEKNDRYQGPHYRIILGLLDDLISESSKSMSKKDKKLQRSSLRPVIASIRTYSPPEVTVKFGQEQLLLDTCALNFFYESLCDALAHGVNKHLQYNIFIRDMFDLGPPLKKPDKSSQDKKESKAMRSYMNQQVAKNRHQARNHYRNKKSDFHQSSLINE